MRKYLETNEKENTHTKLYGTMKAMQRRKIPAINAYFIIQERSQINNGTLQLKEL